MTELEEQGKDASELVLSQYRTLQDLFTAVRGAKEALRADNGKVDLRRKAEAIRAVIQRIECTFTATGEKGGGWGKKNTRLTSVTIYPISGNPIEFRADKDVIFPSSVWALEYHEVPAEAIG